VLRPLLDRSRSTTAETRLAHSRPSACADRRPSLSRLRRTLTVTLPLTLSLVVDPQYASPTQSDSVEHACEGSTRKKSRVVSHRPPHCFSSMSPFVSEVSARLINRSVQESRCAAAASTTKVDGRLVRLCAQQSEPEDIAT
jgi:hypothetical protein